MSATLSFNGLNTPRERLQILFLILRKLERINSSRPNPGRREKISLNVYFHTSLWCLKRFYEGL